MNQFSAWLPSRRQLQQHLARLVDTLEGLLQRLRESIARTVGEAVANAVHEVTRRLSPVLGTAPARSGWHEREVAGTTHMNPNGTTGRLMPRTATGTTMRESARDARVALASCHVGRLPDRGLVVGPASGPPSALCSTTLGPDRGPGQLRRWAIRGRRPGRHRRRAAAPARPDRSGRHQRHGAGAMTAILKTTRPRLP